MALDCCKLIVNIERGEFDSDIRQRSGIGFELVQQRFGIRQSAGVRLGFDDPSQFRFAGALMRQRQQLDRHLACAFVINLRAQGLEGTGIGLARKDLIAIDQVQQSHRLLAQSMNDMPVVDDMTGLAVVFWPAAPERHEVR